MPSGLSLADGSRCWLGEAVVDVAALGRQPVLEGRLVRLEPAGPEHLEGLWPLYSGGEDDPFVALTREQARAGLARAREREDRADWAIVRREDDLVVGEAVLMGLHEEASSMSYRIALVGPEVFGLGYGTEATRLVRDFAFGPLGLHRLALEVNSFNGAGHRRLPEGRLRARGRAPGGRPPRGRLARRPRHGDPRERPATLTAAADRPRDDAGACLRRLRT